MTQNAATTRFDIDATPSGFFALRTPLLPYAILARWGEPLEAPSAFAAGDRAALDRAIAADRARQRSALRAVVDRPEVEEAIFVASPSLSERVAAWRLDPGSARVADVERSLSRYVERMAARPTPFGLFAGGSVGVLGGSTRLELVPQERYERKTRLDMHYLAALTGALARSAELRPSLRYRPNASLYRAAGRLRYVEARLAPATRARAYHLVSVEVTDYLEATLERAAGGARLGDLAAALISPEITREEADAYVGELIDAQILVPEIEPMLTGREPIVELIADLRATEGMPSALPDRLEETQRALASLDAGGLGAAPARYREIAGSLRGLPAEVELPRLFHVDLIKPAPGATLGPRVVDELLRGAALLRRIGHAGRSAALERFCDAFLARWEGREMPLAEVLDEESGIGFGTASALALDATPLLEGLVFPAKAAEPASPQGLRGGGRDALILRLLEDAWARGLHEIELGEDELRELENSEPAALPDAFSVFATLAARSAEAVDAGDFRVLLHGVSGPSGMNLLGRFCHGDPALRAHVEAHLRAEEALSPDAIFAEIVHLPQGRLGNVICRPRLRAHEIPYLGRSGAPTEGQIPLSDLRVSVRGSGRGARVVLRSARLGREVIPRLASAHNFSAADLGVYRFLCALQRQASLAGHLWDWGPMAQASFLPRVRAGRLILSPARFRLGRREIDALRSDACADRFAAAQALRQRRRLPRFVAFADGDRVLPIDLDNALSIDAFVDLLKGRDQVSLIEELPGADELCVEDGGGSRFTHEIVVPFVQRRSTAALRPAPPPSAASAPLERTFAPGSEWLFAKLYGGTASADDVLRGVVRPVVDAALAAGAIDRWFFIRYADPEVHLRLRLHGPPARLLGEVVPALAEASRPLRDEAPGGARIVRMQLDTYEREVERYGGPEGIALAERLFFADSEAALSIVETLAGDAGSDARWRLALAGADRLLTDLGLSLEDKRGLVRAAREGLGRELGVEAPLERQLDARYRRERLRLEALLDRRGDEAELLAPGLDAIDRRSERVRPLTAELTALAARGALSASIPKLAASYVHMHVNRLLRAAVRAQELVIYDLLRRLYASQVARRQGRGA